jgi:hypothetical protein
MTRRTAWLCLVFLAVSAFAVGQPAPEIVPDSPMAVTPIEALAKTALVYLGFAATIMATIQGLKNSFPPLASLFVKFPSMGLILNVVAALLTQIILCLQMDPFDTLEVGKCLLTAFYQIFATAGTHALYKAWLARGAGSNGSTLKAAHTDGAAGLSDAEILTPMREATARRGR